MLLVLSQIRNDVVIIPDDFAIANLPHNSPVDIPVAYGALARAQ